MLIICFIIIPRAHFLKIVLSHIEFRDLEAQNHIFLVRIVLDGVVNLNWACIYFSFSWSNFYNPTENLIIFMTRWLVFWMSPNLGVLILTLFWMFIFSFEFCFVNPTYYDKNFKQDILFIVSFDVKNPKGRTMNYFTRVC